MRTHKQLWIGHSLRKADYSIVRYAMPWNPTKIGGRASRVRGEYHGGLIRNRTIELLKFAVPDPGESTKC